ncbi:MAG: hypothetical protein WC736_14795 [Gallionella sp.]|jgi:hypothetical protein
MAVGTKDMIQQLATINKVTEADGEFITRLLVTTSMGEKTDMLGPKDLETLRRIWHKFFAG